MEHAADGRAAPRWRALGAACAVDAADPVGASMLVVAEVLEIHTAHGEPDAAEAMAYRDRAFTRLGERL